MFINPNFANFSITNIQVDLLSPIILDSFKTRRVVADYYVIFKLLNALSMKSKWYRIIIIIIIFRLNSK